MIGYIGQIPPNRMARYRAAARILAQFSAEIRRLLRSKREEALLSLGLKLSHAEEALAQGDTARANAHLEGVLRLVNQL